MSDGYFLKKNIVIELLIARYRSSPYLISPCSAARFLRYLIKKLLSSFVKSPRAHELALKNVQMQGGPFLTFASTQKNQAEKLLQFQCETLKELIEIADAQDELWLQLETAQGEPLDMFIEKIPTVLSGLVELFYERSGRANYRMIEGLVYQSLYKESLQEVLLYPLYNDKRDFVLTTPRLESEDRLFLKIPHSSKILDLLSRARIFPVENIKYLAEQLCVSTENYNLFHSFFELSTETSRFRYSKNDIKTEEITVRYFGHACVEISTKDMTVLIDPIISYEIPGLNDKRLTYLDLPEQIDTLIITHLHLDHFCVETLVQLRGRVNTVIIPKTKGGTCIDPSAKWILHAIGFVHIVELDSTESHKSGAFEIIALPFHGEHGCLDITSKSVFVLRIQCKSFMFLADIRTTDVVLLNRMARFVGNIDVLFLGMESEGAPVSWVYGSLMDVPIERKWDQKRRLNGSDAALGLELVKAFNPSKVRVYALGREPWLSHIMHVDTSAESVVQKEINIFTEKCQELNLDVKTLFISSVEHFTTKSTE